MSIERILAQHSAEPVEWAQPELFDLSNPDDIGEFLYRIDEKDSKVFDRVDIIAEDMFEMHYPDRKDDTEAKAQFSEDILNEGVSFGTWAHFPWSNTMVRYADRDEHQALRTFRNKNLITSEEQRMLFDARIAIAGLSVGSSVAEQMALGGVGGAVLYADTDHLSVPNLNRIASGMPQVGMRKIDIAAIKTSELDPYIEQTHLHEGITDASLDKLDKFKPQIVFDEVDDLRAKALLRKYASERQIPLIMASDVGEKTLLDVERYDQSAVSPFLGRLNESHIEKILAGPLDEEEKKKMVKKVIGIRNASSRLLASLFEIDETLGGFPQLGTTATTGGSLATVAAREILLGRGPESGRSVVSPRKIMGVSSPEKTPQQVANVSRAAGRKIARSLRQKRASK